MVKRADRVIAEAVALHADQIRLERRVKPVNLPNLEKIRGVAANPCGT